MRAERGRLGCQLTRTKALACFCVFYGKVRHDNRQVKLFTAQKEAFALPVRSTETNKEVGNRRERSLKAELQERGGVCGNSPHTFLATTPLGKPNQTKRTGWHAAKPCGKYRPPQARMVAMAAHRKWVLTRGLEEQCPSTPHNSFLTLSFWASTNPISGLAGLQGVPGPPSQQPSL